MLTIHCPSCNTDWPITGFAEAIVCECGKTIKTGFAVEQVDRKPKPQGLGDKTEQLLKKIGITPERYVEVKRKFGLPPTCNCRGRREYLNRVSEWWRNNL